MAQASHRTIPFAGVALEKLEDVGNLVLLLDGNDDDEYPSFLVLASADPRVPWSMGRSTAV